MAAYGQVCASGLIDRGKRRQINGKLFSRLALCIALLGIGSIVLFMWGAIQRGQEVRHAQAAEDATAERLRRQESEAENDKLGRLVEQLGVIDAADARAKGMTAGEYKRLKEMAAMKKAMDREAER